MNSQRVVLVGVAAWLRLLALALAAITSVILTAWGQNGWPAVAGEPSYRNRPLSAWLDDLQSEQDPATYKQAVEAVQAIGSAAVPILLAELQPQATPLLEAPPATDSDRERRWRVFGYLRLIGQPACTPEAVATLANISVGTDPSQARGALDTLKAWGPLASNAIPQILKCFSAQIAAGGPHRAENLPPSPLYAWTLCRIAPDSREVLLALLADNTFFQRSYLRPWCDNSKSGLSLVREAACDPALPTPSRQNAVAFLVSTSDTNLLALLPILLEEPALRAPLLGYVERQGTNAASVWPLLVQVATRFVREDPQFSDRALSVVGRCGRSAPDAVMPLLLPLTFDERFPISCAFPADEPIPLCALARPVLEVLAGDRDRLVPMLTDYLRHSDWRLRNAAAAGLWALEPFRPETIAGLKTCLSDTNELVQLSAAVTLARRSELRQAVMARLLAAIGSSTMPADLRIHALQQLGQRHPAGDETASVAPVLETAQRDPNLKIQQLAARVLADIGPPRD